MNNYEKFDGRGKKADVSYRFPSGDYSKEAIKKLNPVFGVPAATLGEDISLRLVALLDYLQDRFSKDKTLVISSGYRSPRYNESLRKKERTVGKTKTAFTPRFHGIDNLDGKKCISVNERKGARQIYWTLPKKIRTKSEPLEIEIEFCDSPYEKMPEKIISRMFEIKSR